MSEAGNQYDIVRKIGEGGMGTVYLANDQMLDRLVAIKQLNKPAGAADEGMGDRFQQEALALARLNHPNITHLYSFIPREDTYWMVMEYVEGKTLEEWLYIHKKITHVLAASIAVQMLDGLHHAHRKGIIHRDIKPANVMINEEGEVKIMDFGIARMRDSRRITRHGKSVGTIEYMAPEQIQGKEGDERTDIYAVANIMYELLCGIPPFQGDTDYQLMKDKLEKEPQPVTHFNPGVPLPLQKILFKALEIDPDRRYATAAEFKKAIEECMRGALLAHADLTRVLRASQVFTAPSASTEVRTVTAILSRAQKISRNIKVPAVKRWNRPVVLLVASVVVCALLLLWSSTFDDPVAGKDKQQDNVTGTNLPAAEEAYADKSNSFNETPNEMYRRISEEDKGTVRATEPAPEKKSAKKVVDKPASTSKENTTQKSEAREEREVITTPVEVPAGKNIRVTLAEDISSEDVDRDGETIQFTCAENIVVDNRTIIRKGAAVKGKIVDVIPSSNRRKKALIGFVLQYVQAVDGSMIKLHSERFRLFSDAPGNAVAYRQGQSFTAELKRGRVQ